LARVETIRKKRSKKNMISLSDDVLTSGLKGMLLLIFILQNFKEFHKAFLQPDRVFVDPHLQVMIK
jgi:hypothetical protein